MSNNLKLPLDGGKFGLEGFFRLEVRKARTNELLRELEFENLITDIGLNALGTGANVNGVAIGTGTTAPAFTDTSLASYVAWTGSGVSGYPQYGNNGVAFGYRGFRISAFQFQPGQLNGNYSEVGMVMGSNVNTLFSRALIVDGGGNPTTITILSDEYLSVFYTLRLYPPITDYVGTVDIAGVGTGLGYTRRMQQANGTVGPVYWKIGMETDFFNTISLRVYSGDLSANIAGGTPTGTTTGAESGTEATYVNNSLYNTYTYRFGLNYGNQLHKTYMTDNQWNPLFGNVRHAWSLDTGFTKLNTQVLTVTFRISWARV